MTELTAFNIDSTLFDSQKIAVRECLESKVSGEEKICAHCPDVFYCDKIKDFSKSQFDFAIAKLKACQASNSLNSCLKCDLFFECGVRQNFVRANYERLNEGRNGEFDF